MDAALVRAFFFFNVHKLQLGLDSFAHTISTVSFTSQTGTAISGDDADGLDLDERITFPKDRKNPFLEPPAKSNLPCAQRQEMKVKFEPFLPEAAELRVIPFTDSLLKEFARDILAGARRVEDRIVGHDVLFQATLAHILKQFEGLVGHIASRTRGDGAIVNVGIGLNTLFPHSLHELERDIRPTALKVSRTHTCIDDVKFVGLGKIAAIHTLLHKRNTNQYFSSPSPYSSWRCQI